MTLVKRNGGYEPLLSNFFDDFWGRDRFTWPSWPSASSTGTTIPKVNIQESSDNFVVEMAAPGMTKDDFKVELDHDTLTISSEKEQRMEDKKEDGVYSRREFSYQSFRRTFYLPETVDSESIEAKYANGILKLVIPKREEAKRKPVRTIKIS